MSYLDTVYYYRNNKLNFAKGELLFNLVTPAIAEDDFPFTVYGIDDNLHYSHSNDMTLLHFNPIGKYEMFKNEACFVAIKGKITLKDPTYHNTNTIANFIRDKKAFFQYENVKVLGVAKTYREAVDLLENEYIEYITDFVMKLTEIFCNRYKIPYENFFINFIKSNGIIKPSDLLTPYTSVVKTDTIVFFSSNVKYQSFKELKEKSSNAINYKAPTFIYKKIYSKIDPLNDMAETITNILRSYELLKISKII